MRLSPRSKCEAVKRRHAVGLGPQPHHPWAGHCSILHLEQERAVERDLEARAGVIHPQGVPLVGGHGHVDAIATLASDDIERTAHAVDSLVEHDIVLDGVGAHDVVAVSYTHLTLPTSD